MIIRPIISEGTQYRVGSVKFTGNKLFSTAGHRRGAAGLAHGQTGESQIGAERLGDGRGRHFHPQGAGQGYRGRRGLLWRQRLYRGEHFSRNLKVLRIPNTETGTMDLEFQIEEGQKVLHRED